MNQTFQAAASLWRQRGVIYEVYPRSFQDSNGDGISDLEGLRQRSPYFVKLGIDAFDCHQLYRCSDRADIAEFEREECGKRSTLLGRAASESFNRLR